MKRRLFLLLIFLIGAICYADVDTKDGTAITSTANVDGFTSNIDDYDGQVVKAAGGGGGTSVSDDFTGSDLTAWYDPEAGAACSGTSCNNFTLDTNDDELDDDGQGVIIYYTSLGSADQIVCMQPNVVSGAQYGGPIMRQAGNVDGSANGYTIRFNSYGQDLMARSCDGDSCSDMASAYSLSDSVDADDWCCWGVQNTSTSTIMYFWDYGATEPTPGTSPAFSTQPTVAWCDDGTCDGASTLGSDGDVNLDLDGTPPLVESGNYAGVYSGSSSGSAEEWAAFKAWGDS